MTLLLTRWVKRTSFRELFTRGAGQRRGEIIPKSRPPAERYPNNLIWFAPAEGECSIDQKLHINQTAIIGAGIMGLMAAYYLCKQGHRCVIYERGGATLEHATSYVAGGMLAPYCELDGTEKLIGDLGLDALDLWRDIARDLGASLEYQENGSLVVAHGSDKSELERFALKVKAAGGEAGLQWVSGSEIDALEPALAGRFRAGYFVEREGHVNPRSLMPILQNYLIKQGVEFHFQTEASIVDTTHLRANEQVFNYAWIIDCRGLEAGSNTTRLRGVKGEIIIIETAEIEFNRPVRLLHPRYPIYIIPRADNLFLIGATSIENEDNSGVTVRSALELLSAAYSLHSIFGEARIVELNSNLRPAFPDNLPRIDVDGTLLSANGLYRHGYLLAPKIAAELSQFIATGTVSNRYSEIFEVTV